MIATSLASGARPFWRLLESYGIDAEKVFRASGLDPELLDEPKGRYNAERRVDAWVNATELIDDPCFGLKIADFWKSTDLHALGCALFASSTLRTALGRISRYINVINDIVGYELADEDDSVSFTLTSDNPSYSPPFAPQEDSGWAVITSICRAVYGKELNPVEVRFQHSAPECSGDFDAFFRCPVSFDSAASAILFARADVDRPLQASNREIVRASERVLTDVLDKLRETDFVMRVKTLIAKELPSGAPSAEMIAGAVLLSPRTFQRNLAAKGASYRGVVDSVRYELTQQYLADPSLTLTEISFLVGFSGLSAFSRAYKRWTGQTPREVREAASI